MNAKFIQDLLNEHGLIFRITDERQKFDTYKKSKDIAGILEQVASGYLYDETGNRVLNYQVEFWGENKDFDQFREIVKDNFPNNIGVENYFIYSQPVEFLDFHESGGSKKFTARVVFQVVEVIGGVSGKSTTIKVDGVLIDFRTVLYRQDKSLLPYTAFGVNKEVKLVSEMITIALPITDNIKNSELLLAALDDSFNASYTIEWKLGAITKTFDAVLRVGVVEYSKTHEPILVKITFERALPREIWQVSILQRENFWEVSQNNLPFDAEFINDISTESAFRTFLETLNKLDTIGYAVKNTNRGTSQWDFVGFFTSTLAIQDFIASENNIGVFEAWDDGYTVASEEELIDYLDTVYTASDYALSNNGKYMVIIDENQDYWVARLDISTIVFHGIVRESGTYDLPMGMPVLDYTQKTSVEMTIRVATKPMGKPLYFSNGFSVLFLLNSDTKVFIDDLYNRSKGLYKISYGLLGSTYNFTDMAIQELDRQNTENANQVLQVSFTESEL